MGFKTAKRKTAVEIGVRVMPHVLKTARAVFVGASKERALNLSVRTVVEQTIKYSITHRYGKRLVRLMTHI